MKLSSISLISAALSAGSAIAAPGPLRVRALEQVNLFERDLDVYPCELVSVLERDVDAEPVDLFTRFTEKLPHQIRHNNLAIEAQIAETRTGTASTEVGRVL